MSAGWQTVSGSEVGPGPRLTGLEQRVLRRLRRLGPSARGMLCVGFSGGADSLALAGVLGRLAKVEELGLLLCHVDHCLRPDSAAEQIDAEALAAALGVPFRALRAADDPRRLHPGVGLEEAARRERFRLLAAVAGERDAPVVLAHHRADQAETVMLHLLRGTGPAGIAGMGEVAELSVPWWPAPAPTRQIRLWRPLIEEPRAEVRAYAAALGLPPVVDPSNEDEGPRRNALRRQALPMMERIVPGAEAALVRYAVLAADEDRLVGSLAEAIARRVVGGDGVLDGAALGSEAIALQRRVVHGWLAEVGGVAGVGMERVEAVIAVCGGGRGGSRIEIGGGVAAVGSGGRVWLERAAAEGGGDG